MDGVPFRGGLRAHDSWDNYSLQDGLATIGYRLNVVGKLSVNLVPTDIRILHYLLTYTILPRGGNHGVIQHEDVKIYEYLGVDVQGARKVVIDSRRCIDATTIKQMRRQIEQQSQGVDEVDEEENRLEEEEQAYQMGQEEEGQPGPSSSSQEQPSMRDILQAIQAMELNINQRMDKIEKNQARMLRKIRRVEAYTFDEDEAEDDDDDFWS
ncbi:hypothetical protein PIB30_111379 [Stylosanthes scabra]|uniref:Uncharacterized protein n=2 Tax=Stylosanthes scabra TaxID=79078 RepID=A0ABU6S0J4_9FABA|nr:hypothetical protein [Stylosanthes scabra]